MPNDFWNNLGSNLGTQFGEAVGASLFGGGSAGSSNPESVFYPWSVSNMGTNTSFNPNNRSYSVAYNPNEQGAYDSLFGIAQNNFNSANTSDPYAIGQEYYNRIRAMQQPGEARRLSDLRDNLFASGRLGLGVGANAANPELAAYYQSLFEQDNALAGQSLLAGQDIVNQTLQRGLGAMQGAQSITDNGLDMIKLSGILGTYGRPVGAGGGSLIGGGGLFTTPGGLSGATPGAQSAVANQPGGTFGGYMPGSDVGAGIPVSGFTGGGMDDNPEFGDPFTGGDPLSGITNGPLHGFTDAALGPLDELFGGVSGLFDGLSYYGNGAEMGPPDISGMPDPSAIAGSGGMFDPLTGELVPSADMASLPGAAEIQADVNQWTQTNGAVSQINQVLSSLPPQTAAAIVSALRSGNVAQAQALLAQAVRLAGLGGGAGGGWSTVDTGSGVEQAGSGSSWNGLGSFDATEPIWG